MIRHFGCLAKQKRLELELLVATAVPVHSWGHEAVQSRSVTIRHDKTYLCVLARLPWKFQGKWSKLGEKPRVFWKSLLRSSLCKAIAMFYVPSGTPSTGSSDSGDGAPASASRNLAGLLDEQRKRGIGAALLTITGTLRDLLCFWRPNIRLFKLRLVHINAYYDRLLLLASMFS